MKSGYSIGLAIVFLLCIGAPRAQEAKPWSIDADISEADFTGAHLADADLTAVFDLTQPQVNSVRRSRPRILTRP